jgi:ribonuclease Y
MLAAEIGANVKLAKRAGFLHDIGKALDQEIEGHHAVIGAAFLEKLEEHSSVVEAVRGHHEDALVNASVITVLVHAANTLSSSRPGARQEVIEKYITRLADMENLVNEFKGIDSAYVLQAGREVRAMVCTDGIDDQNVIDLANDIASKLRTELTFPGQVRVTVLKESRFVDFAK